MIILMILVRIEGIDTKYLEWNRRADLVNNILQQIK